MSGSWDTASGDNPTGPPDRSSDDPPPEGPGHDEGSGHSPWAPQPRRDYGAFPLEEWYPLYGGYPPARPGYQSGAPQTGDPGYLPYGGYGQASYGPPPPGYGPPPPGYWVPPYPGYYQPPPARRRNRAVSVLVGIVSIAVAVSLVIGGANLGTTSVTPDPATPQMGSFAGYIGYMPVNQISASWRVPAILNSSAGGGASTWIGVQGTGKGEFFQVGTTESYEAGTTFYEAFWSDPAQGFHARIMMPVSAGDEIRAQISEESGAWQASVDDVTEGHAQAAPTSSGVFTSISLAEWIQEDPSLPHSQHIPYPDITSVTLSQLRVNGSAPSASELQPQIMVLPHGRRIEPGPLVDNGFTTKAVRAH